MEEVRKANLDKLRARKGGVVVLAFVFMSYKPAASKMEILLGTGQQQIGYIEGATASSSMVTDIVGTAYLCLSFFEGSSSETVKDRSMLKHPFHMAIWFHMSSVMWMELEAGFSIFSILVYISKALPPLLLPAFVTCLMDFRKCLENLRWTQSHPATGLQASDRYRMSVASV